MKESTNDLSQLRASMGGMAEGRELNEEHSAGELLMGRASADMIRAGSELLHERGQLLETSMIQLEELQVG